MAYTYILTKQHLPVELVYYEEYQTQEEAVKRELQLKGWSLLLCTDYNETLVKYSTEGLEDIYVGKYMLQLPSEETIRQYLIDNMPDPKQFENS